MEEQKTKTKPHQKNRLGWGERVCPVLQVQNSKAKENVYIYVLCGAVSRAFYPNFSIFKSCCMEGTGAVQCLRQKCPGMNFLPGLGFPGAPRENLGWNLSWLSYVVSVVQSGNGKWFHFQPLPALLSSGGFSHVLPLLEAELTKCSWEHLSRKEKQTLGDDSNLSEQPCYKRTLGLYIL